MNNTKAGKNIEKRIIMKFDCSKDNLINALSLVSRGVANKTDRKSVV